MAKIAIVEDDVTQRSSMKKYLTRYGEERNVSLELYEFSNAIPLLEGYSSDYDIIFLDIKIPYLNGMEAAKVLRKQDENVVIIFVTNLVQYAVQGYSVNALDYVLKPVTYTALALTMSRALRQVKDKGGFLLIKMVDGAFRLRPADILYVESSQHNLLYHLYSGDVKVAYDTMYTIAEKLKPLGFSLCSRCYLVNLKYVRNVKGYTVDVNGTPLRVGQTRKKQFMEEYTAFIGGQSHV